MKTDKIRMKIEYYAEHEYTPDKIISRAYIDVPMNTSDLWNVSTIIPIIDRSGFAFAVSPSQSALIPCSSYGVVLSYSWRVLIRAVDGNKYMHYPQ